MELIHYTHVAEFSRRAEPFLAAREAEHCLPLGICATLLAQPGAIPPDLYLATVEEGGVVVAAAVRTPPYNPVLSLVAPETAADGALALLADDLRSVYGRLPGVFGAMPLSRVFAERWRAVSGETQRLAMRERIYRLETVVPVTGVPGRARRASEADRAVLARWVEAFTAEALGDRERADGDAWVTGALASPVRGIYVWEDAGRPVTMVGYGGPTPHGMRIGPVYTPPELRRRGYASAGTAAASQALLDAGRRFVFLFTDLANPTSNHIYQQIGYRPVIDVEMYEFTS